MARKGVIESRLTLNISDYKKNLEQSVVLAKQHAAEIRAAWKDPIKLPPLEVPKLPDVPSMPGGGSGGGGSAGPDPALKTQREAVRQLTNEYRDYRVALREGTDGEAAFLQQSGAILQRLKNERSQLEQTSQGYAVYTLAIDKVTAGISQVTAAQARAAAQTEAASAREVKAQTQRAKAIERAEQAYRLDRVRQYREALAALNVQYERDRDRKRYIRDVTDLTLSMERFRTTLPATSREVGALDRVLGQSVRNLNTVQGRLSGLGISQQVNLALTSQLQGQFSRLGGVAGGAASLGLNAMGGSLAGVSSGAALAGGAILGVGVGAAQLVSRGVPQVKSFQNSINILAASGAKDLDKLDQTLGELQNSAGRAARQFSRAELAAALADTTKAGVSADDALVILRSSLQLAAAEGTSLTESTALVLKAIRQYQLDVDDAATVTDRLAQAGLLAAGNANDISTGLSRVAGTGRAAGVEMSDLIGMLIELDNAGVEASDRGANSLNSALTALAALTPKAKEQLRAWNIEVTNSDGSARLAGDILVDLGDKLRTAGVQYDESTDQLVGNGDALRGLAQIMGTEGGRAILNLAGKWRDYSREVQNSQGVSEDYSDQMTQGLEPAQKRLKTALDDLGKSAATIFAPGMEKAADALAAVARQMDSVTNRPLSFGNIIDSIIGADGEKRLQTVYDDIAKVKRQMGEVQSALNDPKNTTPDKRQNPFGIGTLSQGEVDKFVRDNEALLTLLENQLKALQQRRDTILEEYGLGSTGGGGGRSGGRAADKGAPTPPPPTVDPAVQAEYERSLKAAQDRATQAQISAMQQGAARVEAQRQADLGAAKVAFDANVAELQAGSERYNQFLKAYNQETAAINSRAQQDLQSDAERRLTTAAGLREQIDRMASELAASQTNLAADPLQAIQSTFERTTSAITQNVDRLTDEVRKAYQDGSIDKETYYAELDEISRLGNAQLLSAEEQFTKDTRAELQKRKDAVRELADAQARALAEAQVAGMEEGFEKEQAQFRLERQERLKQYRQQLVDFQGTLSERRKLLIQQNATEVQLAQNNVAATKANLAAARENFRKALEEYGQQVKQKNEEALRQTIANQKAISDARIAAAQQQFDGAEGLSEQTVAYSRLLKVQQDAVAVAQQFTRFERERGATAQEITDALNNEAAAQRDVVGVIQSQIDRLRELRDAQLSTIESGSSVVELFREAQKITGQQASGNQIQNALQAQLDAQGKLYQQQVAMNAPLEDQLETLRAINATREQATQEGAKVKVSGDVAQTISENASRQLAEAPAKIEEATGKFIDLDTQIRTLGETLESATGKLVELLEQAGSGKGLEVRVTPVYDASALREASKAVEAAAAAAKAAQEELGEVQREETKRTQEEMQKAQGAMREAQSEIDKVGQEVADTASKFGARAGSGLIEAFAQGVLENREQLGAAIRSVMQTEVRDYLTGSNAKKPPLNDVTGSGRGLVSAYASGIRKQFPELRSASLALASIAKPMIQTSIPAIPTSRPASYPSMAGGGGDTYGDMHIHVDAKGMGQRANSIIEMEGRQFAQSALREARMIVRQRGGIL